MEKLKVIVGGAKGLSCSRKIYCELVVLDSEEGSMAKDSTHRVPAANNPVWNSTITFDVGDQFAGLVVRVFEWHRLLSCKCLGIIRLKFNTQKLADQVLDTWFPLSAEKRGKKGEGEIHLKVVYGQGPQKVDIILSESSTEDSCKKTPSPRPTGLPVADSSGTTTITTSTATTTKTACIEFV